MLLGEILNAGGNAVCTGTHVITQDDIDAGKVRQRARFLSHRPPTIVKKTTRRDAPCTLLPSVLLDYRVSRSRFACRALYVSCFNQVVSVVTVTAADPDGELIFRQTKVTQALVQYNAVSVGECESTTEVQAVDQPRCFRHLEF